MAFDLSPDLASVPALLLVLGTNRPCVVVALAEGKCTWPWPLLALETWFCSLGLCEENEQQLNPGPRTELMIGEHLQLLSYVF